MAATSFASALSEGQPAQLDLGEEAVPCLVVGFTGADVVLAPSEPLPEDALAPGYSITYLLIEAGGTLQALKADVRRAGGQHDVGPAEADDEAGDSFLSQVELGRLSFAERACKSRRHGRLNPFIGHSANEV